MPKSNQTRRKRPVAKVSEIPPGERKIIVIEGRSIGIFNLDGKFVAVLNVCPHQQAAVCTGQIRTRDDGEITTTLTCPDHAWEFDLNTGYALNGERKRLFFYSVTVEGGTVFITF
jgi:nitrite reductase/ring-hydroxylating ferredoxin subunit